MAGFSLKAPTAEPETVTEPGADPTGDTGASEADSERVTRPSDPSPSDPSKVPEEIHEFFAKASCLLDSLSFVECQVGKVFDDKQNESCHFTKSSLSVHQCLKRDS